MYLLDTTLRDGEQTPGVCFMRHDKMAIVDHLTRLGVREIELRSPVLDPEGFDDWMALQNTYSSVDFLCWCRTRKEDLEQALRARVSRVHMALPLSDIQLSTIHMDGDRALESIYSLVHWAQSRFEFVSVGAQDVSRAPPERLLGFADCLCAAGVHRIRLADTLGLMLPHQVQKMLESVMRYTSGIPIEFHAHNDLGMATANAWTALESGASMVSATVLGIGERCGNANLEQLAFLLNQTRGVPLATQEIHDLCRTVARAANWSIPVQQPLVGTMANQHQSGIHVDGLLKNGSSYTPYDPALVGRDAAPELLVGALTGRHALKRFLEACGECPSLESMDSLLMAVRQRVHELGRSLGVEELCVLYKNQKVA